MELVPVGHDDDLGLAQAGDGAHLADQERHRQALAGALRVPDDAAPVILVVAALAPRLAVQETIDGLLDRAVLLVARHRLDHRAVVGTHERHVVVHDVEDPARVQDNPGQDVLLGDRLCAG